MTRLAVVSTAVPPSASGQALVLQRLFADSGRETVFFSDSLGAEDLAREARLGHYVRTAKPTFQFLPLNRLGPLTGTNNFLGLVRSILRRAREIELALRDAPPEVIVGCSGDPFDLTASYRAAARLGVAFVAYLFDDPVFQWPPGIYRRLARTFEPHWANAASAVICPNEVLAEDVVARNPRVRPVIVRNPMDDSLYDLRTGVRASLPVGQPVRVVYTGSVYHAQGDAFANLVTAMAEMPGRFHLHVYTSQPQASLEANGVVGPHVTRHDHLDGPAVAAVQQNADILFLPLAFHSSIQEVLRSSAPGKTGEYLAAGKPVLAHAPADSFISMFFRAHEAGHVIDQPSPASLADALQALSEDEGMRQRYVDNARIAAHGFTQAESRRRFWEVIDRVAGARA